MIAALALSLTARSARAGDEPDDPDDEARRYGQAIGWAFTAKSDRKPADERSLRFEAAITSQASVLAMTRMWCGDSLSGTLSASEAFEAGTRQAWCRDNPQEAYWTSEVAAAPVGLNLRLSGNGQHAWFGVGVNLATAALSTAGIGDGAAPPPGVAPLRGMGGVDLAFPLSDQGQRLHMLVGGGGTWIVDERTTRIRPFYGVAVLVDLLHLANERSDNQKAPEPKKDPPEAEEDPPEAEEETDGADVGGGQ